MTSFGAIITLHKEGHLADKTLSSIELCRQYAEKYGVHVKFYISLDRANKETIHTAQHHPAIRETDDIFKVDFGDLGLCRNFLISKANTEFIGTFDGDDYWSRNWINSGINKAKEGGVIAHPKLTIVFGTEKHYFYQRSQNDPICNTDSLLSFNLWNSCMITKRALATEASYEPVSCTGHQIYGYEDWHWNCKTIAKGFLHLTAPETIIYVRKKPENSLCRDHDEKQVCIRPNDFFRA